MHNIIKLHRVKQSLTQDDLAQKLHVSRQTIVAIENNKYLPSLGLAIKIAKVFKTPIETLFIDDES